MALRFITACRASLVRITDLHPTAVVDTVSGTVPVDAIGVVGFNVQDRRGRWHYIELPDAHLCLTSSVELYPVQLAFAVHRARHFFDDVTEIRLADGSRVPFQSTTQGYPMTVVYGPPYDGATLHPLPSVTALAARLPADLSLVWRRLGFPYNQQWRMALHTTEGAFPAQLTTATNLPPVDSFTEPSVLKGRMRKLPIFTQPRATALAPGEKVYMDGCGPVLPSVVHRYTDYMGCVDAGTGYARLYPCRGQTEVAATAALTLFIAELRSLIGRQHFLSPLVVRSDGGSAFISHRFREFCCRDLQSNLSLSAPYTPEQNSFIERVWGSRFGTARVLMAAANLPVRFHPWAVRMANWLHNRLPSAQRGNKSPYELATGRRPDMSRLRAFGCAAAVLRPTATRIVDKGYKKLTADHAEFGIYLGPSEEHPAHTVYVADSGSIRSSAHVLFDETTFPGAKHVIATDWATALSSAVPPPPACSPDTPDGPTEATVPPRPLSPSLLDEQLPGTGYTPHNPTVPPPPISHVSNDLQPATERTVNPPTSTSDSGQLSSTPIATPAPPTGLNGRAWVPVSQHVGVDGRARRRPSAATALQHAYAALTSKETCERSSSARAWTAALMAHSPSFAYVAATSDCALPHPTLTVADCRIPKGYKDAMTHPLASYWKEAIDKEWTGIMSNDTLDFIPRRDVPPGANVMNCHFVFDCKPRPDGSIEKLKARLVADGNTQRHGVDFEQVFATVVKMSSIRLVFTLAASLKLRLWQLDVKQAFLCADLPEELYMRMPPHLVDRDADGSRLVCKLRKSLYGLRQAAREWADHLNSVLLSFGFRRSTIDTCVYRYDGSSDRLLILLVYVDDLVCCYSHEDVRAAFVSHLTSTLPIDDRGPLEWVLRMQVAHEVDAHRVVISQQQYALRTVERYHPDALTPVKMTVHV